MAGDGIKKVNDAVILENIEISRLEQDVVIEGYVKKENKVCSQE